MIDSHKELFKKILRQFGVEQIPPITRDANLASTLSREDLVHALAISSALANENNFQYKNIALEVVSKLFELEGINSNQLKNAARVVLARLGNFPGFHLIDPSGDSDEELSVAFGLEIAMRKNDNQIVLAGIEKPIFLTDFQLQLWSSLNGSEATGISAPTSAGKSFIVALFLSELAKQKTCKSVVYLVPTRALIRQVSADISSLAKKYQSKNLTVVSVPKVVADPKGDMLVYVLTQERFNSLLGQDPTFSPEVLIVDEATEIANDDRGILLTNVVNDAMTRKVPTKIVFLGALFQNPEYFFSIFRSQRIHSIVKTGETPVSQNLLFLDPIQRVTKQALVSISSGLGKVEIGHVKTKIPFRGPGMLPSAALTFTKDNDSSIVFSNAPAAAEKCCEKISEEIGMEIEDGEVDELVEFVKDQVHPNYKLIQFLKKGCAFHHRLVPDLVKEKIEDLFREKRIRFLCCTSTLLQGVNLPTRNIFISDPKSGRGNPMSQQEFGNLAGRAGRLTKELNGNIWCIGRELWDNDPTDNRTLVTISDAFTEALEKEQFDIELVLNNPKTLPPKTATVEAAVSKIVTDFFMESRSLETSQFSSDLNRDFLKKVDSLAAQTLLTIDLPKEILKRNSCFSPWKLQNLLKLINGKADVLTILPLHPFDKGSYDRLSEILQILNAEITEFPGQQYEYITWLSFNWMFGKSFKELLDMRIRKYQIPLPEVTSTVRNLVNDIDDKVRFTCVKSLKAYEDLLNYYIKLKGLDVASHDVVPLHSYLEFGACDPLILSLIGLGVSRTTAIIIKKSGVVGSFENLAELKDQIERKVPRNPNIPMICKKDLERIGLINLVP